VPQFENTAKARASNNKLKEIKQRGTRHYYLSELILTPKRRAKREISEPRQFRLAEGPE
jgi:hypothetical protein